MNNHFDVVICGGGLAGLTLARQLSLGKGNLSILVLEKHTFPLSEEHSKVGESTVEISGHYFSHVLKMEDYFKNSHYKKLGFRFFLGSGKENFDTRPEIGLSSFPFHDSYQIDRGLFENDLYEINQLNNIAMKDGISVKEINFSDNNDLHEVKFLEIENQTLHCVKAKWVIDASGRRRLIQRKLKLGVPSKEKYSSVWFRVNGRLDIDNLVPKNQSEWHNRVPNKIRYFSTNHLLGFGYWVWLIPLPSGKTSVGVVTAEQVHPFKTYNTKAKVLEWLKQWEPKLYDLLTEDNWVDFGAMRNYSYSTTKVFSEKRWACTGESAMFTDPFYSPGSNIIAYENCMIAELINDDLGGKNIEESVNHYNDFIISTNAYLTKAIQSSYYYFDKPLVKSLSFLWDIAAGWTFGTPSMLNGIFINKEKREAVRKENIKYYYLISTMEGFFQQWGKMSKSEFSFDFIDYLSISFIKKIYDRNLVNGKSIEEITDDFGENIKFLEEFAQVIFIIALEDIFPERLKEFKRPLWLNAWAISLSPNQWQEDGLFQPSSSRRELTQMLTEVKALFNDDFKRVEEENQLVSISLNL